jgi:hypothetical protein
LRTQQRLAEPGEHHAAREVGDHGEADLRRGHQPLQRETGGLAQRLARRRLPQPRAQQRRDDRGVGRRALLREEDPEHGLFQLRRAHQLGDAVVPERLHEPALERLRQPGAVDVEALQVGVEVLAGAMHVAVTAGLLARRPVAAQLGQVGEDRQQLDLLGERALAGVGELLARGEVAGEHPALVVRVDVEAEQQAAQILQPASGPFARRDAGRLGGQVQLGGLGGFRGAVVAFAGERLQPQQRRARLDLAADRHRAFLEPRAERRPQHRLHLHALQHEQRRARLDLGADGQRRRDDQR